MADERLFVALTLPEAIGERLREAVATLRRIAPATRFVAQQGWHVTLKFIGESSRRAEIVGQLRRIRRESFEYAVAGYGFFPNAGMPRILWCGLEQPSGQKALQELAAEIDAKLAQVGVAAGTRPFRPHLTLARTSSGDPHETFTSGDANLLRIARSLDGAPQPHFGRARATEFILYRSQLLPEGAQYTELERFPLL